MKLARRNLWLPFLFALSAAAIAQGSEKAEFTVPIDVSTGYIFLDAKVNGEPLRMVFDTGASLSCITPETAERLGIKAQSTIQARGAGSKTIPAGMATVESIEVAGAKVENTPIIILDLPKVLQCDGIVGFNFYREFVSTVDYERSTMTFSRPSAFSPPEGASVLPMLVSGNHLHAEVSIGDAKGWCTVDTGNGGGLVLFKKFLDDNGLREKHTLRWPTMTGMGVGGAVRGELLYLSGIKLGDFALPKIATDFTAQTEGAFATSTLAGNFGYDVLRRFKVSFDVPGRRMVLAKSNAYDSPSIANRTGLFLDFDGKAHSVVNVDPGGPAEKAGVKVGDTLVSVVGVPAGEIRALKLRMMLRGEAGREIRFEFKNGEGREYAANLKLRELIPGFDGGSRLVSAPRLAASLLDAILGRSYALRPANMPL
jgi:hypothetical protein